MTRILTSDSPVISFQDGGSLNSSVQAALDIYWYGNTGVAGGQTGVDVGDILTHYNSTKHPGQSTQATLWAVVCVTIGDEPYYIGVGNGSATVHDLSVDGTTYHIDFSGLEW